MEFGIEKCAMLVTKSGKWHITEGMELPNQDKIRTIGEKETYKYQWSTRSHITSPPRDTHAQPKEIPWV